MSDERICRCDHVEGAHRRRKVGYYMKNPCQATVTKTGYSYHCPCPDFRPLRQGGDEQKVPE